MKSYKEYILAEANITDMDIAVYPKKVKMDENGVVTSYDLDIKLEGDETKNISNSKLKKAIVKYLGDNNIKDGLASNPSGMVFNVEVYADNKGMYIELDKKTYFK